MDQPGITCISRRSFIAGSALAFASLGFGLYGCAEPADNGAAHVNRRKAAKRADQYFENGTIATVNDQDDIVEALAVKDGRIVCAGTPEDVAGCGASVTGRYLAEELGASSRS